MISYRSTYLSTRLEINPGKLLKAKSNSSSYTIMKIPSKTFLKVVSVPLALFSPYAFKHKFAIFANWIKSQTFLTKLFFHSIYLFLFHYRICFQFFVWILPKVIWQHWNGVELLIMYMLEIGKKCAFKK